jgi:hypothetical protein
MTAVLEKIDGKTKFARWKDFSIRMAKACYSKRQNPCLSDVLDDIESFFEYGVSEEYADLYVDWDSSKNFPGQKDGPGCACDIASEICDGLWGQAYNLATTKQRRLLDYYWERQQYDEYDEIREKVVDRWESPMYCCVRSGMDFAYSQSAGVAGFTVGDLLAMYPEGLPDWLKDQWTADITQVPADTHILF